MKLFLFCFPANILFFISRFPHFTKNPGCTVRRRLVKYTSDSYPCPVGMARRSCGDNTHVNKQRGISRTTRRRSEKARFAVPTENTDPTTPSLQIALAAGSDFRWTTKGLVEGDERPVCTASVYSAFYYYYYFYPPPFTTIKLR